MHRNRIGRALGESNHSRLRTLLPPLHIFISVYSVNDIFQDFGSLQNVLEQLGSRMQYTTVQKLPVNRKDGFFAARSSRILIETLLKKASVQYFTSCCKSLSKTHCLGSFNNPCNIYSGSVLTKKRKNVEPIRSSCIVLWRIHCEKIHP